jgi:hypothetical protein
LKRLERAGYTVYQILRDWDTFKKAVECVLVTTQEMFKQWHQVAPPQANVETAEAAVGPKGSPAFRWSSWLARQRALEDRILRVTEKRIRLRVQQPIELAFHEGQVLLDGILSLLEEAQQVQASVRQTSAQSSAYGYVAAVNELYEGAMAPVLARCEETCVHVETWIAAHLDLLSGAVDEMLEIQKQFYAGAAFVITAEGRKEPSRQETVAPGSIKTCLATPTRPEKAVHATASQHSTVKNNRAASELSAGVQVSSMDTSMPEHSWRALHEQWGMSLHERPQEIGSAQQAQTAFAESKFRNKTVEEPLSATETASSLTTFAQREEDAVDTHPTETPLVDVAPTDDQLVDIVEDSTHVPQNSTPTSKFTTTSSDVNAKVSASSWHLSQQSPWPASSRANQSNVLNAPIGVTREQTDTSAAKVDDAQKDTLMPQQLIAENQTDRFQNQQTNGTLRPNEFSNARAKSETTSSASASPARDAFIVEKSTASPETLLLVEQQIRQWTRDGSRTHNIRALLSSLHEILDEHSGWERLSVQSLIDEHQVRIAYRRALLLTHPDRGATNAVREPAERFLRERVFEILRSAYKVAANE